MARQPRMATLPRTVTAVARDAINDTNVASRQREWRAFVREKHLAERVLEDEKTKRALRKQIKELQVALAKACDWALDSADVIADENLVDPEDGEDEDFRATISELRKLSKQPEAERHIERQKAREQEKQPKPAPTPDTGRIGIDSDGEYMTDGKRW